jgi:hypothetical protein
MNGDGLPDLDARFILPSPTAIRVQALAVLKPAFARETLDIFE